MIYDDLRIRTLWFSVATWNHLERTSFCKLCGEEPPEYPQNVHKSSFCLDKTIHPSWSLVQDPSPAWVAENQRENSGNIRKSCGLVSKWKKLEYPKGCLLDKDRLDRGGFGGIQFRAAGNFCSPGAHLSIAVGPAAGNTSTQEALKCVEPSKIGGGILGRLNHASSNVHLFYTHGGRYMDDIWTIYDDIWINSWFINHDISMRTISMSMIIISE